MHQSYLGRDIPFVGRMLGKHINLKHSSHQKILDALLVAIENGESCIQITGNAGIGKTLLRQKFLGTLNANFIGINLTHPSQNTHNLFLTLASKLGASLEGNEDQKKLIKKTIKVLSKYADAKQPVIICVEQAQLVAPECFGILRLLMDKSTKKQKTLQVVLFGQPELDQQLANQRIQQQIKSCFQLDAPHKDKPEPYLDHYLRLVGLKGQLLINNYTNKLVSSYILILLWGTFVGGVWVSTNSSLPFTATGIQSPTVPNNKWNNLLANEPAAWSLSDDKWNNTASLTTKLTVAKADTNTNTITLAPTAQPAVTSKKKESPVIPSSQPTDITEVTKESLDEDEPIRVASLSNNMSEYLSAASDPNQVALIKQSTASIFGEQVKKQTNQKQIAGRQFQQAFVLAQQGLTGAALDKYNMALQIDPTHEAARREIVRLLVKDHRLIEVEPILRSGLQLNPGQTNFAKTLSRIQVEKGDIEGALDTLQQSLPQALDQADYRAFMGALFQRNSQHKEAINHYVAAVTLSPNSGVWLMGLGISLQEEAHFYEAHEAFKRASMSQELSQDLQVFVDHRIKIISKKIH